MSLIKGKADTKTVRKELRSFGLIVGGIFSFIGILPVLIRGTEPRIWSIILGGWLIIQALSLPMTLRPIYKVWMFVGHIMGWVNTRIILSIVFYGIITPMGFIMRLSGKEIMLFKFDSKIDTYRVKRSSRTGAHMRRQF